VHVVCKPQQRIPAGLKQRNDTPLETFNAKKWGFLFAKKWGKLFSIHKSFFIGRFG
jgi:hypothetical protein